MFLQITGAWVKLTYPRIHIWDETEFLKADIVFYRLSTLVVQNIGCIQAKQMLKIILYKITEIIEPNTILEVTDNKGLIQSLVNIKCIMMVVDNGFPFRKHHTTQAWPYAKEISDITNTRQRLPQTTISNKTININITQFILYSNFVDIITPQTMFRMFPQISGV